MNRLNQYIRAHRDVLMFTAPEQMPRNPVIWIATKLRVLELQIMIGVLLLISDRGALSEELACYVREPSLPLPLSDAEQLIVDSMFAEISARGYSRAQIARVVELSGVMVEGLNRLGGFGVPARGLERVTSINT